MDLLYRNAVTRRGLEDRCSIPNRDSDGIFCLSHSFQSGSETHSASYTKGTGDSYPRGKAAWAWGCPRD